MIPANTTLSPSIPVLDALAALQRAGLRAAHEALRTNTDMVIGNDGKIEHVNPHDYLRDRADTVPKPLRVQPD